jgi:hypothetical protein
MYRNLINTEIDIVVLMLGSNDAKTYNWDPEEYTKDYA